MDGYNDSPYFHGASRQRGSGLGSLALSVGRFAIPFLRKMAIPAARRVGKAFIEEAAPELLNVISGQSKPRQAFKRAAQQTLKKQLGGAPKRRRVSVKTKRQTKLKKKKIISRKKFTKRSRADFFSQ